MIHIPLQKKASELISMTRDLAFKERDKLIKEGTGLPWEQPGYTDSAVPRLLPRWVDGIGLAIPVKSGWFPVQAGISIGHFAQGGVQSNTGADTERYYLHVQTGDIISVQYCLWCDL